MDEMFSTAPPPAFSMCGAASCVSRNSENRFRSKAQRKSDIGISKGLGPPPPALFTRIVRPPKSRSAAATAPARSASFVTSQARPVARPPEPVISRATALAVSACRSVTTTAAPAPANVSAMARPIPAPAPVTSAIWPSSRKLAGLNMGTSLTRRAFPGEGCAARGWVLRMSGLRGVMPSAPGLDRSPLPSARPRPRPGPECLALAGARSRPAGFR